MRFVVADEYLGNKLGERAHDVAAFRLLVECEEAWHNDYEEQDSSQTQLGERTRDKMEIWSSERTICHNVYRVSVPSYPHHFILGY